MRASDPSEELIKRLMEENAESNSRAKKANPLTLGVAGLVTALLILFEVIIPYMAPKPVEITNALTPALAPIEEQMHEIKDELEEIRKVCEENNHLKNNHLP